MTGDNYIFNPFNFLSRSWVKYKLCLQELKNVLIPFLGFRSVCSAYGLSLQTVYKSQSCEVGLCVTCLKDSHTKLMLCDVLSQKIWI